MHVPTRRVCRASVKFDARGQVRSGAHPIAGPAGDRPRLTVREQPEVKPPPKPRREFGARARQWAKMLEDGVYPSRAALARGEGVSRAALTRALGRLT